MYCKVNKKVFDFPNKMWVYNAQIRLHGISSPWGSEMENEKILDKKPG